MGARISVKLKFDEKPWKKMEGRLKRFKSKSVKTGWWRSYYPDGTSVAQVAAWNEEGHLNGGMFAGTYTPPRPFIRTGFLPKAKVVLKEYSRLFFLHLEGNVGVSDFWNSVSKELEEKMKESILEFKVPGNSPVTVSIKGFNDPLINTSTMYDSVKTQLVAFSKSE